jgi:hypothetical protein
VLVACRTASCHDAMKIFSVHPIHFTHNVRLRGDDVLERLVPADDLTEAGRPDPWLWISRGTESSSWEHFTLWLIMLITLFLHGLHRSSDL